MKIITGKELKKLKVRQIKPIQDGVYISLADNGFNTAPTDDGKPIQLSKHPKPKGIEGIKAWVKYIFIRPKLTNSNLETFYDKREN